MPDTELTELYLKEIARRGMAPGELVELAARQFDVAATSFFGHCLTRPVFLGHADLVQLDADLVNLFTALTALPERLFGGDFGAFARAVGLTEDQIQPVLRSRADSLVRFGRADLYPDTSGFRLMEFNLGSTTGGGDNAMLNRAMLAHPVVAEFVREHSLGYVDTLAAVADLIVAECGISPGDGSLIAIVDWPPAADVFSPLLWTSCAELAGRGLDMVPCHLGQLSMHDGRVWLDRRPVDVIYRIFMIEDLLHPDGPRLINPVLDAAERGEVKIFTPMDAEVFGSKGALALLSSEDNQRLCTEAERASLARLLPWTRPVRPGSVSVGDQTADLLEYATDMRAELILKPTAMHGGLGIQAGWLAEPDEWEQRLKSAMNGQFVLQQRIHPAPEQFPGDGGLEPWVITWGAFLCGRGYGGVLIRGTTDPDAAAINMTQGAFGSCVFHEQVPGQATGS